MPQEMRREAKLIHDEDRPTLSFGMVTSDGEGVAFRIERGDGKFLDLVCTMDDLSDIFYYIASLATAAGEERDSPKPPFLKTYNDLTPIPAKGLGFQPGPGPDETMLVIRLTGFDMTFAVPNSGLKRFASDLGKIAATLSADQTSRNIKVYRLLSAYSYVEP